MWTARYTSAVQHPEGSAHVERSGMVMVIKKLEWWQIDKDPRKAILAERQHLIRFPDGVETIALDSELTEWRAQIL